jgi:hypothetical protein
MELEPLLIRAEALFRRFQRIVESIDRKASFPAPRIRQRPALPESRSESAPSTHSVLDAGLGAGAAGGVAGSPSQEAIQPPAQAHGGERAPLPRSQTQTQTQTQAQSHNLAKPPARADPRGKGTSASEADAPAVKPERVITPELRALLKKKVEVLPREAVRERGEGRASGLRD